MRRQPPPPLSGAADLTVGRDVTNVAYLLHETTGRGSTTGPPERMADAFRSGEGVLARTGEPPLRLSFVGYTAGSDTAYFEVRERRSTSNFPLASAHLQATARRAPRAD